MTEKAKMMVNMAMSMAELNGAVIARMDLQRHESHYTRPWYHLDVWFADGTEFTIREDCTIVKK